MAVINKMQEGQKLVRERRTTNDLKDLEANKEFQQTLQSKLNNTTEDLTEVLIRTAQKIGGLIRTKEIQWPVKQERDENSD